MCVWMRSDSNIFIEYLSAKIYVDNDDLRMIMLVYLFENGFFWYVKIQSNIIGCAAKGFEAFLSDSRIANWTWNKYTWTRQIDEHSVCYP